MATKKNSKTTKKAGPSPSMEVIPAAAKPVKAAAAPAPAKPAPAPVAAKPVAPAPKAAAPAAPKATFDQIKARAYEVWLRKGCPSGQDVQNWEEAERELGVR